MAGWFSVSGSFKNTFAFLKKMQEQEAYAALEGYAQRGVDALSATTPKDTAETAGSWSYEIIDEGGLFRIVWSNSSTNKGVNIAIILQYGHGTGTGGYVQGRDYINPALRPVFDEISDKVWKAVTSA